MSSSAKSRLSLKFWIAIVLFLLSGFSSLIYQVIWTRLLVFVFGSTTFATSTVLAVFMGGLALGSFLCGRYVDKIKNRFVLYGALEGLIAVCALLAPLLFQLAIPIYKFFFDQLHNQIILFGLLRFMVVSAILLLPTSCMGGTLPLLSRFVTDDISEAGDRVGSLYAANTLGAVAGATMTGFFLIPEFGLSITTYTAAGINLLLLLFVIVLDKYLFAKSPSAEANTQNSASGKSMAEAISEPPDRQIEAGTSLQITATSISFCISGAIAMIYEVAWTRSLLMLIGSTTYAFTIMLSTFLIGICSGSFIASRFVHRLKNPLTWFACGQICLCLSGFISLVLFNLLPDFNLALTGVKSSTISMFARFLSAGCIMLPITIFLGVSFPIAVKICARNLDSLGRSVGNLYAANTIGAIAGAFLGGFLIIPALGSEKTIAVASITNMVIGLALLTGFGALRKGVGCLSIFCSLLISAHIFIHGTNIWDMNSIIYAQSERRQLLARQERLSAAQVDYNWLEPQLPPSGNLLKSVPKLLFYKEGPCANVAVTIANPQAFGPTKTLFTNGHADASDSLDMENQAMLAAFPLMILPSSRNVCVVGWGSGATSGYALRFPIHELVTAEIEPAVIETSPFFHHVNFSPESDKRSIIEPSDGRNYLLGTNKKFDVIISEPSNPWQAGVCNLFTKEYFEICGQCLSPQGIFSMWSQVNEIPTVNLVQVYAALHKVFPYVYVFDSGAGDTIALASKTEFKFNIEQLRKVMANPSVKQSLSKFAITTPEDLIARIRLGPAALAEATGSSEMNTDDMNHLEYDVAKSYENKSYAIENEQWFLKHTGNIWESIDWGSQTKEEKSQEMIKIALACLPKNPARMMYWAKESMKVQANARAISLIAQEQILKGDLNGASRTLSDAASLFPDDARIYGLQGVIALRKGDYLEARRLLSRALELDKSNYSFRYFLALTYSPLNLGEMSTVYQAPPSLNPAKVVELCREACDDRLFVQSKPGVVLMLADAYLNQSKYNDAERALTSLPGHQSNPLSMQLLARAYAGTGDTQRSWLCWNIAFSVAEAQRPVFYQKAMQAIENGNPQEALRQIQHDLSLLPADQNALKLLDSCVRKYPAAAPLARLIYKEQRPPSDLAGVLAGR